MSTQANLKSESRLLVLCILLGIICLFAFAASKFTPGKLVVIITGLGFLGYIAVLTVLAFRLKRLGPIAGSVGLSLASVILGTYILLFTCVYFFQDSLANRTSSFFQPKAISAQAAQALIAPGITPIDLTAPDGVHLRGWLVGEANGAKKPLLIYFGGSGSESSEIIPYAGKLTGWSVALINYRGFGLSEGTPTQADTLADALFIYDNLAKREDIDAGRVVSMGYSLGSGVAVHLSARRPVAGTILISPYDYWSLIGVKQSPIYAPLSGIMKHYFDSISLAPAINAPLLCLVGSNDTLVPPELSRRLANAWGGETRLIEYPGEDHSLLFHDNNSWADITKFLGEIKKN